MHRTLSVVLGALWLVTANAIEVSTAIPPKIPLHPANPNCFSVVNNLADESGVLAGLKSAVRWIRGRATPFIPNESHPSMPFLKAIAENPKDDNLRLVYADWLEEHGQPEHAEFIRASVRLEQLRQQRAQSTTPSPTVDEEIGELTTRTQALLNQNHVKWMPKHIAGADRYNWTRGFIDRVHFGSPERFHEKGKSVLDSVITAKTVSIHMPSGVNYAHVPDAEDAHRSTQALQAAAALPELSRVDRLEIGAPSPSSTLTAEQVAGALGGSPYLGKLKELRIDVQGGNLTSVFSLRLQELSHLDVNIGQLSHIPNFATLNTAFPTLKNLRLRSRAPANRIDADSLGSFVGSGVKLESIRLMGVLQNEADLRIIAQASNMGNLRSLETDARHDVATLNAFVSNKAIQPPFRLISPPPESAANHSAYQAARQHFIDKFGQGSLSP